jgi:hypothetical protein
MFGDFDANDLIHPPQEMSALADQWIHRFMEQRRCDDRGERRTEKRRAIAISVHAVPLDADLRPMGQGFIATTREISQRGLVLIHYKKAHTPFLAVELADAIAGQFHAVMHLLRCRPVGPYFEMAGNFLTRAYDLPGGKEPGNRQLQPAAIQAEEA